MICPSLANRKIYADALKNLYEYMDIKNIIKRMQEIDKFKLILFDKNQRIAFDMLPKPGIGKKDPDSSLLTMESIVKTKQTIFPGGKEKLQLPLDGNYINQRIFELLDPELKNEVLSGNFSRKTRKIYFGKNR